MLYSKNVILSEANRSGATICVAKNLLRHNKVLRYVRILVPISFLFTSAPQLPAQPIGIQLTNSNIGLLQVDSANWKEAWIELSGASPDEKVTKDDLRVTSGNRVAEILSVDSVAWRFRSRLAVSFVLDNSGSMFHAFDSLTRMCDSIIDSLPTGAIGQAVVFDDRYRNATHLYTARSSTFIAQREFTDSMSALRGFWHFFDTIRTQFTPLYDAIATAVTNIDNRRIKGDTAHNDILIVVTDGQDNASRASIEELEELLASAHLRLFAINFRVEDEGRLPWLAHHAGGAYFLANDLDELRTTLRKIVLSFTRQYHVRYRFPTLGPSSGANKAKKFE
jgi:hypothetical protein